MIALDKQAHALGGAVITLAAGYRLPVLAGFAICIAAGALKEWYDSYHPLTHTADLNDFLATAVGGVVGCVLVLVLR